MLVIPGLCANPAAPGKTVPELFQFNNNVDLTEPAGTVQFHNCSKHNNHFLLVLIPFCSFHIRKNIDRNLLALFLLFCARIQDK